MALTRSTGPLVWLDLEMTGLNPLSDTILSLCCFITDSNLNLLDTTGYDAVIHHSSTQLSSMNEWCINQHGKSGLTQQCLESTTTAEVAAEGLLDYVQRFVPVQGVALLAGNSIHADKMFLMCEPWQDVLKWLHYRLFDVSSVKEMVRRWCKEEVLRQCPVKKGCHTAREDVVESMEEARFYMGLLKSVRLRGEGEGDG